MEINKRVRQTGNKKKGSATQPSCLRVDQFDVSWLHLRDYLVLRVDAQETVNLHRQKCNHYNIRNKLVEYLRSFFTIKIKQFRDNGTQPAQCFGQFASDLNANAICWHFHELCVGENWMTPVTRCHFRILSDHFPVDWPTEQPIPWRNGSLQRLASGH